MSKVNDIAHLSLQSLITGLCPRRWRGISGILIKILDKILGQILQKCGLHSTGCLNTYLKVPNERRDPAVRLIVMLLVG